jgi:hypothetical protein
MLCRLAVAVALLLSAAATQASDPAQPLPGETLIAFQCRSAFLPQARSCVARCEAAFAGAAEARFECVHACTKHSLFDMAQCRAQGAPAAVASMVASR